MRNPDQNRLQLAVNWLDNLGAAPAKDVEDTGDFQDVKEAGAGSELPPCSLPAPVSRARRCGHCAGELVRSQRQTWDRVVSFGSGRRPYRCVQCRRRRGH